MSLAEIIFKVSGLVSKRKKDREKASRCKTSVDHRNDKSARRRKRYWKWNVSAYICIQNIYNQKDIKYLRVWQSKTKIKIWDIHIRDGLYDDTVHMIMESIIWMLTFSMRNEFTLTRFSIWLMLKKLEIYKKKKFFLEVGFWMMSSWIYRGWVVMMDHDEFDDS